MNKLVDPEETEKWTSWSWREKTKCYGCGTKGIQKTNLPLRNDHKTSWLFSVFSIFNTFHQFSGFCVGRNFILCSIPDILGFEFVKAHEKW